MNVYCVTRPLARLWVRAQNGVSEGPPPGHGSECSSMLSQGLTLGRGQQRLGADAHDPEKWHKRGNGRPRFAEEAPRPGEPSLQTVAYRYRMLNDTDVWCKMLGYAHGGRSLLPETPPRRVRTQQRRTKRRYWRGVFPPQMWVGTCPPSIPTCSNIWREQPQWLQTHRAKLLHAMCGTDSGRPTLILWPATRRQIGRRGNK